jgi:hypothetical protein
LDKVKRVSREWMDGTGIQKGKWTGQQTGREVKGRTERGNGGGMMVDRKALKGWFLD